MERFNDGAITALSNSAIDHLVSLRALSNTLQHLPLLVFLFSPIFLFFLLGSGLSLRISLLFLLLSLSTWNYRSSRMLGLGEVGKSGPAFLSAGKQITLSTARGG